jgi:glycerol uptake facilitator-like aquaporin
MDRSLIRAYVLELVGTFTLVFFGAAVVCVNQLTAPAGAPTGTGVLHAHQPGLVGIALGQGLSLAVLLAATVSVSGGCLNPALTLTLWVFNRLGSRRAAWLLGAQLVGAALAGILLSRVFDAGVLREARLGTPHLSSLVYPAVNTAAILSGTAIELVLTFFLAFAIFSAFTEKGPGPGGETAEKAERRFQIALAAGLAQTACTLVGYPLTGAAVNPARWFGTVLWELALFEPPPGAPGPLADTFAYVTGPVVGALLAGVLFFRLLAPPPPQARK